MINKFCFIILFLIFFHSAKQIEEAMTADEKQKLYEAIGYQEQPIVTEYPKEVILWNTPASN